MTHSENPSINTELIALRWGDFDRFQHVTNSAYIEIAQEARMAFAQREFTSRSLEIPAVFVRKVEAEYLRPILPNTTHVRVETQVVEIGTSSFTTRQELYDATNTLTCIIEVVQIVVDPTTARPRAITQPELNVLTMVTE